MNPLKKYIIIFLTTIVILLLLWFLFLRNFIYKKIKQGKLIINAPYSKIIKIKGARKVIFTNKASKQKWFDKIFKGKIIYEINPYWDKELVFTPKTKRIIRINTGIHYSIIPYTNQFSRGKNYELKKQNEIIRISYL